MDFLTDSEAEMTRDNGIWSLDTQDMTQVELEEYKKELLRQEERETKRRIRNIRLVIYAVVLFLLITGVLMIPGTIRAQKGPVTLTPLGDSVSAGVQTSGPEGFTGSFVKRLNDHTFQLWFKSDHRKSYENDSKKRAYGDGFRRIKGVICQKPERLNRQRKSSVSYSDGSKGTVWYETTSGGHSYLMVEYKGQVRGYYWSGPDDGGG